MAFRIATNTASVNTQRWLGIANAGQTKALERLSSGYKINSAKDDAAGIAIAAKLSVKAVALTKSVDSGNQALAMLQTAEGGIDQISNILTRLKSIATQSASANTVDRAALDVERGKLESQINNIAVNTRYGDKELLHGTGSTLGATGASITLGFGISGIDVSGSSFTSNVNATLTITGTSATLAIGDSTQSVTFSKPLGINLGEINFSDFGVKVTVNAAITDIPTAGGGFVINAGTNSTFEYQLGDQNIDQNRVSVSLANFTKGGSTLALSGDISDAGKAKLYMDKIDAAIGKLTTERGKVGAAMNQISYQVANLETMYENTKAAVSTIMDADFASEMAEFTKFQILNQSGVAMLAQANQIPQMILSLLK